MSTATEDGDAIQGRVEAVTTRTPGAWHEGVDELERRLGILRHDIATARYELRRLRSRRVVRLALLMETLVRRPWLAWRLPRSLMEALRPVAVGAAPVADYPVVKGKSAERAQVVARPARRLRYPHLRVAHAGASAMFSGVAGHVGLHGGGWEDELDAGADLLLVEPPLEEGLPLEEITAACERRGIPAVLVGRYRDDLAHVDAGGPFDVVVTDDPGIASAAVSRLGQDRVLSVDPAIDQRRFNPMGWAREHDGNGMIVVTCDPDPALVEDLAALAEPFREELTVYHAPEVDPDRLPEVLAGRPATVIDDAETLVVAAHGHRVAIVHPGLHPSSTAHVRHALGLAACGTPIIHPPDRHLARLLPADTLHPATTTTEAATYLDALDDPTTRERTSILARRHVLAHHTTQQRFDQLLTHLDIATVPPPTISVLLATKRPEALDHAHAQIARQTYPALEIITICHGGGFDPGHLERLNASHRHPTCTLHAPAGWPLGDVLNLGLDRATGDLVTKMDDDDFYGPEHLTDLYQALTYTRADVVGKLANFVYLSGQDLTIDRYLEHEERDVWHLPGATILMHRELLSAYRFSRVAHGVETALYERLHPAGVRRYSTHRFNFIRYRGGDHTYGKSDDEFLTQAEHTYVGLAVDAAMLRSPDAPPTAEPTSEPGSRGARPRPGGELGARSSRQVDTRGAERLAGRWPPPALMTAERLAAAEDELARTQRKLRQLRSRWAVRLAMFLAALVRRPWRLPWLLVEALRQARAGEAPPPADVAAHAASTEEADASTS